MKTRCPPAYHHNVFVVTHALVHMVSMIMIEYIYIYIYIYSIWYKLIHFHLLLKPAIQRMGNTPNILHPRHMEQGEPHPHFIFYCKLSKLTLDYISELIKLNYSFNLPFKFSLKTIKMGSFSIL